MLIHDACKATGLTRKAIEYYEKQNLLRPAAMENGYRNYEDEEIAVLKEIALLRKLGLNIAQIKTILRSEDKPAALAACKSRLTGLLSTLNAQRGCIGYLIDNGYDVDGAAQYAARQLDENRVIRERLAEAFPGSYGSFISFHFGRFLNEKIDTPEKEAAYGKILEFLDGLADIPFPEELKKLIEENVMPWNEETMQSIHSGTRAAANDFTGFMQQKREIIQMYLAYCKSDEYKASPGYKMKALMREFQQASGYVEVFVENMKVLSHEYAAYLKKLQESNAIFLREYPEAADILGRY